METSLPKGSGGHDQVSMLTISKRFEHHLRFKVSASSTLSDDSESKSSTLELDSHADSPVLGRHARILERTGRKVSVSGFSDEIGKPILLDVVHGALVYDCPFTGDSILIIIYNALYMQSMEASLIPPFMMRLASLEVDECPKFLSATPALTNHSIYSKELDIRIPLRLEGIISCIDCRMPSDDELDLDLRIELTPKISNWNPHSEVYRNQEEAMVDYKGELKEKRKKTFIVSSLLTREMDPGCFNDDLIDLMEERDYTYRVPK